MSKQTLVSKTAFVSSAPAAAIVAPGAPGFVWVNKEEIAALAARVGMTVADVREASMSARSACARA